MHDLDALHLLLWVMCVTVCLRLQNLSSYDITKQLTHLLEKGVAGDCSEKVNQCIFFLAKFLQDKVAVCV